MSVYVDTSAFLAVLDSDDPNHGKAKSAWVEIVESGSAIITSNYTVVEAIAVLRRRFGLSAVRLFQHDILAVVDLEWVDASVHRLAVGSMMAGGRRGPSLVDCVGFEIIDRLGLESVFVYDKHFEDRGLKLIG
ncbi:MAG: PIN domain-containing protein [Armatimonadetes bacterium]|nr:PIN domain-containing protein [Armatimonadota bacterium]